MKKSTLLIILLGAYALFISYQMLTGGSHGQRDPREYDYAQDLENSSYVEVDAVKKPFLSDTLAHIKPWVIQTVTASGYWEPDTVYVPGDTVEVEVSGIEMEDGTKWLRVDIDGKPVHIENADWFIKERIPSRWAAGVETAVLDGFDIGAFGSYRVFSLWKINAEVAVVVDLNTDLAESPDWIALEGRLSVPVSGSFELGGGLGIQATVDEIKFPYVSAGAEYRF